MDLIKKINYIGGEGVVVGDTKVWTNSEEVKKAMHEQIARNEIKEQIGTKNDQMKWGKVIGDAIRRQMDAREGIEEKNEKYQPGMLIINGEKDEQIGHIQEIYYVDSFGEYWDEITHRRLEKKEVQEARLEELRQVYQHKVYKRYQYNSAGTKLARTQ